MNYKMIRFVISWVLKVEGMLMLLPALVGAMYQEKTGFAYLIWGLLCIAAGLILCFRKPSNMEIYSRDGFVCVSCSGEAFPTGLAVWAFLCSFLHCFR